MSLNYSKLRGKIVEKCGTLEEFSRQIDMTPTSIGRKIANKSEWKQSEIIKACGILGLETSKIPDYFFAV
jgi:hypothetical protein